MQQKMVKQRKQGRILAFVLAVCLLAGCGNAQNTQAGPSSASATQQAAPSAEPTALPAPAKDPLSEIIAAMPLREKVGQLFLVRPDALDFTLPQDQINDAKANGATALTADMKLNLADYPVGGIVLFGKNITDPDQLTQQIADWQAASAIPLLVGVDEEGGQIARIANDPAFSVPQYESAYAVGAGGQPQDAQEMGRTIGTYLAQYGFNLDFAPDADVNTNPDNPVIGTRAFSDDPAVAAGMVAAAVAGFHEAGMACTIKHFPGHGDTAQDSHVGCATTDKTWAELQSCELLPFATGIAAGADLVMAGHITTPNATTDGLPASLSKEMLTDCLRRNLGFTGIIITDSLAMEAITDFYTPAQAACTAIQAGVDLLLMPNGLREAYDGVLQAVESGEISEERIDESLLRILTLKQKYGLL